ncbi:glutathione-dependent formaldehyde-activating enzyme [Metarhizium robertsii]|uniref:Glutathione-dependent formaldehyde-activating enzyme n=1 Tax=Metarhizium robertsii TaxID=568076 RepID=A0A014N0Y8_9HYPO|nr:glutathione-dependent formaldehyde-activating enzyme [Metarhizium robertsii]
MSSESWALKPPYQPPDTRSQFRREIQGSCHCRKVLYWISTDKPLASKFCHCVGCQVIHGAPFQWAAIFEKSDVAFETGVEHLKFYNSATKESHHELPCKVSCKWCGSHIMDEGRNMALVFPPLLSSSAAQKENFKVQCHIFYSQRCVDIDDGKPKWSGLDGRSELL